MVAVSLKKDLPFNELAAEIIVEKMLAENELVSIYAMFLQEIRYDEKLKKLYERLKTESIQSISRLFEGQNREVFKNYSELIADLINSVILSCEILHTRANFLSNKEVLKRMIIESLKQSKDLRSPRSSFEISGCSPMTGLPWPPESSRTAPRASICAGTTGTRAEHRTRPRRWRPPPRSFWPGA